MPLPGFRSTGRAPFRIALSLALLAGGVEGAQAGAAIVTPTLEVNGADHDLACYVVNAGSKAATVSIALVAPDGTQQEAIEVLLQPGQTGRVPTDVGAAARHCRVTGISKGKARVSLCVRQTTGGFSDCLAAVSAP